MKKVWFLGLLAAAILAGCSDNDDNGDEVKPGGGQVESPYLPQRIAQVEVFKDGEKSNRVCYYYDTRGRVSMVMAYEWGYWDYWSVDNSLLLSYFEDYSIDAEGYIYHILRGKIVAMYKCEGSPKPDEVKYVYDGDYLQLLQWIATTDRYGENNDTLTMDFSFLKDNLERYAMNKDGYRFQVVFEYGNHANVLNIDMFYFLMRHVLYNLSGEVFWGGYYEERADDYLTPWLLGIVGERSACLPESMEVMMPRESGDGEEKRAYTCKYTMKGEYVSEMAILDAAGQEAYRFVFSYEE